jgi:O-antigen ligase
MSLSDIMLVVGLVVSCLLALGGLVKPFWGLLVLIAIHFIQPAELIPALVPFRIELVYGVLLLASFAIYLSSSNDRRLLASPIFTGALVLLGVATFTIPFAIWRGGALDATITLAKLVIILFLIGHLVDSNDKLLKLLWVECGLLAWFAGTGFLAFRRGQFIVGEGLERASGLTSVVGGPNELAGLIVGLTPFLIVLFICTRNFLARLLLLGCAALGMATLALTGSRASMLSLGVIAIYFALRSKHKVAALASVAVLACAIWFWMPQDYRDRFATVGQYAQGGELDASNELRLHIWKAGLRMFMDHPILGVGTGQFRVAYGTIYSGRRHGPWMNPHNLLLQIVCELGVIGLCAFIYFFKQIATAIRSVLRLRGDPRFELNYQLAVACNAMLLGVIAVSCVGHTLYRPYWYLLGGLAAANRLVADHISTGVSTTALPDGKVDEFESQTAERVLVPDRWD